MSVKKKGWHWQGLKPKIFIGRGIYCFDNGYHFCNLPIVMEHLEIELKFYISNLDVLRGRLTDLGAACIGQRTFEHNVSYETDSTDIATCSKPVMPAANNLSLILKFAL